MNVLAAFLQSRKVVWLATPVLFVYGFWLSFKYGLSGFHTAADIDFYAGWLVANGKLPFVDWFSSYSVTDSFIQALVIKLFGTTWTAYIANAAACNGLFVVLGWWLARNLGLPWWLGLAYAVALAGTYYPVYGFPESDKNGYLFLMIALVLLINAPGRRVALCYGLAGLMLVLGLFSKANPTFLYPIVVLPLFLTLPWAEKKAALKGVAVLVALLGLAALAMQLAHPEFLAKLRYYALTLPSMIAANRAEEGFPFLKLSNYTQFAGFTLAYGLLAAVAALLLARRKLEGETLAPAFMGAAVLFAGIFHVTHVAQPMPAHVTLVVMATMILNAALWRQVTAPQARLAFGMLLAVVTVVNDIEYIRTTVKPRSGYGNVYDLGAQLKSGAIGIRDLKDVRWLPTESDPQGLEKLRAAMAAVESVPGNLYLAGLSPMFYALGHKAPVQPVIYVMPGHSSPPLGSAEEKKLAAHLAANLAQAEVTTVVAAPEKRAGLEADLKQLNQLCGAEERAQGIAVLHLCRQPTPEDQALGLALLHAF